MAESAEGARLLSEYTLKRCIEGSNPSLSASLRSLKGAPARQAVIDNRSEGCRVVVRRTETDGLERNDCHGEVARNGQRRWT